MNMHEYEADRWYTSLSEKFLTIKFTDKLKKLKKLTDKLDCRK